MADNNKGCNGGCLALLVLFFLLFLMCTSCRDATTIEISVTSQKYPDGSLVCIDDYKFIVIGKHRKDFKYKLKKIDCKSEYCMYTVTEDQIKLCK